MRQILELLSQVPGVQDFIREREEIVKQVPVRVLAGEDSEPMLYMLQEGLDHEGVTNLPDSEPVMFVNTTDRLPYMLVKQTCQTCVPSHVYAMRSLGIRLGEIADTAEVVGEDGKVNLPRYLPTQPVVLMSRFPEFFIIVLTFETPAEGAEETQHYCSIIDSVMTQLQSEYAPLLETHRYIVSANVPCRKIGSTQGTRESGEEGAETRTV